MFNHWGVGKPGIPGAPGVWRDNGIMLFVATDDRQAWIALGDGIDGPEETRVAQQIIDDPEDCKSCDYHQRYTYRTPMRVHTSSSSSGGSFGGGGGSSSGFSGGSSSGGGAGGGW